MRMCKEYGTYDANRAMQNGYNLFLFRPVKKTEWFLDFRELSLVNYGDKAIIFLPASLGYGERGVAGGVWAAHRKTL
jgi:hypothetical protein